MMVFFCLNKVVLLSYLTSSIEFVGSTTLTESTTTESTATESVTTAVESTTSVVASVLVSFLQDTTVSVKIVNNAKIFFMFLVLN
jgi:hypothetical protein